MIAKVGHSAEANDHSINRDASVALVLEVLQGLLAYWSRNDISPEFLNLAGGRVVRMVWKVEVDLAFAKLLLFFFQERDNRDFIARVMDPTQIFRV